METFEACANSLESTPSPSGTGDGWDELRELFDAHDEGLLPPTFDAHVQAAEGVKADPVQPFQWCNADESMAMPEDPDSLVFGSSPSPSNSDLGCGTDSDGGESNRVSPSNNANDDPREDKKRRNREAAKLSRAKKKRMLQNIEEHQEELEEERAALRRENQTLRYMNQALEGQVAYFHGLFKAAFNNGALSKLPETALDSAWHVPHGSSFSFPTSSSLEPPAPARGTSVAMAIVLFAALSGGIGNIDLAPPPSVLVDTPPIGHRSGRMLLSVEDSDISSSSSSSSFFDILSLLNFPLICLAVTLLVVASISVSRRMIVRSKACLEPVLPMQAGARKNKVH
mmetsp:Transcript_43396/g.66668  ORF Transcript_43396/g.66668 Transcript_43396/m.66668 type:complete len:341 (+) Transcript_43396:25-1047(+)